MLPYQQVLENIRRGKIAPVYYLVGEETYLQRELVETLLNIFLPLEARDFNLHTFDGQAALGEDILMACETVPFLAEHRVILVKHPERLST